VPSLLSNQLAVLLSRHSSPPAVAARPLNPDPSGLLQRNSRRPWLGNGREHCSKHCFVVATHQQAERLPCYTRSPRVVELGQHRYVASGAPARFPASNPSDVLIDLSMLRPLTGRTHLRHGPQDPTASASSRTRRQLSLTAAGDGRRRASLMGFTLLDAETCRHGSELGLDRLR